MKQTEIVSATKNARHIQVNENDLENKEFEFDEENDNNNNNSTFETSTSILVGHKMRKFIS